MRYLRHTLRNVPFYTPLIGILFAGLLGFYFFSYDRVFQVAIAIGIAVSYAVWGVIYHLVHKDFYWEVVVEYIIVASLGLTILFSLIFRA